MTAWKKYIILALLLLLIGAVILVSAMPMRVLFDRIELPSTIKVNAVSGTLWSGATEVEWSGRERSQLPIITLVTRFNWIWCPLYGLLTMCVDLDNPELTGKMNVTYKLFGNQIRVYDAALEIDINQYQFVVKEFTVSLSGNGQINLQTLEISLETGILSQLSADGNITGLRNGETFIGDYKITSALQDSGFVTDFKGGTDDFSVQGQTTIDFAQNQYRYYADLRSESKFLLNLLQPLAQSSGKGRITFSNAGRLAQ